jgi:SAM-dependent methyltransferase
MEIGKLLEELHALLDSEFKDRACLTVLEAGCGSACHIRIPKDAHIVGIDVSEAQLQRNSLLSERILGDIQCYDFEPEHFDLIICWDVLEHLARPDLAIQKLASAVKKGGMLILKAPNVLSLKGFITKYSPQWVHSMYYKCIMHRKLINIGDIGPFPTYLRLSMTPNSISKIASAMGLSVILLDLLDGDLNRQSKIAHYVYKCLNYCVKLISCGLFKDSEFVMVLQK